MKTEENKILSVEDVLHLQSDKHEKEGKVMPEVDTSKYVLRQKPKAEVVRSFVTTANITEEQRRQFNQGSSAAQSRNAALAEQARLAVKIAEKHAEEEAIENAKTAVEKTTKTDMDINELAKKMRDSGFDFNFGAFIEGSKNLKETI